jgi:hypothetical protein
MSKGHTENKKVRESVNSRSEGLCEFPGCNCNYMVEHHHVFGASNRKKLEMKETVYALCYYHHLDNDTGVHCNKENRLVMRRVAIDALMNIGWTEDKIRTQVGKWDGE